MLQFEQAAPFAPWEIRRTNMDAEPVRSILQRVRTTGNLDLGKGTFDAQAELFDVNSTTSSDRAS